MPTAVGGLVVDANLQVGSTAGTLNAADLAQIVALAAQIHGDMPPTLSSARDLHDQWLAVAGQAVFDCLVWGGECMESLDSSRLHNSSTRFARESVQRYLLPLGLSFEW